MWNVITALSAMGTSPNLGTYEVACRPWTYMTKKIDEKLRLQLSVSVWFPHSLAFFRAMTPVLCRWDVKVDAGHPCELKINTCCIYYPVSFKKFSVSLDESLCVLSLMSAWTHNNHCDCRLNFAIFRSSIAQWSRAWDLHLPTFEYGLHH